MRSNFLLSTKWLIGLTIGFGALSAQAADLYVSTSGSDSNAGTSASAPLRTILKASQLAQPGTVVNVAPGNYAGGFQVTKSGTSSAPITYKSTTKWGARLTPSGSKKEIWDQRGSYTNIVGFDIDGNGSSVATNGIYVGGSYVKVENNHVHHVALNVPCNSGGGSAIGMDGYYRGVNGQVLNNVVHHIGPAGCSYVQGIYISTSAIVKNNLAYNVSEAAIHLWHDANNVQIINNTVAASGTGIIVGGGDFYYSTNLKADNVLVHNNIVFDNAYGISEQGKTGANNKFLNNLVYSNSTKDWDLDTGKTHSGSINADPQFVAYNLNGTNVDYRLKSTSPALNRGTSSLAPATDLNAVTRPQGGGYDIGAYELPSTTTPSPTPTPSATPSPTPRPSPSPTPAAALSVSPSSLVFPNQLVGTTSALQVLTIKNTGTTALSFPSAFVMSGDFAFGGSGTCQVNVNYAPGATCTATVVFKPTAVGARTGSISIPSNASSTPVVVPFSGTGISATPAPAVSVSPTALTFAGQRVGTTSALQVVTIKNTGTADLKFPSAFVMSGDFAFGGSGTCQVNVNYAPGATCTATVVFKPTAVGTRTGSLSISSNASSTPSVVRLTGTGL